MKIGSIAKKILDKIESKDVEPVKAIATYYAIRDGDSEVDAMAIDAAIHAFETIKEWTTI